MDPTDWDRHYREADTPWDHGEPSPGLADFLAANPGFPRGTVVVPGCGYGHDARAWAAAGHDVLGIDLSPTAAAAAAARASGVPRLRFEAMDFLAATPAASFDWMFEHTLYCAIAPSGRAAYAAAAARWVRPGGWLLAVHYLDPEAASGPPHRCDRGELLERFGPAFELVAEWTPRSWAKREGREGMFWWRRRAGV